MLDAMRAEAKSHVLAAYDFTDNVVKGTSIEFIDEANRRCMSVRFSVNGVEHEKTAVLYSGDFARPFRTKEEAFHALSEAVSEAVGLAVVEACAEQLFLRVQGDKGIR